MTVATQPWSEIVWPDAWSQARVTATRVKGIPAIGRGLNLIEGMAKQMPIDAVRGDVVITPRPSLLEQPDPDQARSWLVDVQVEDYEVHGNALALVTVRDFYNWPLAITWLPAAWSTVTRMPDGRMDYWCNGVHLNTPDVIHVKRGADPLYPWRGIGVVEQYLAGLGLMVDQQTYQSRVLKGSAVPSVAIITPNEDPSQDEIDRAQLAWTEKYNADGPTRKPAVLPAGTTVTPLAWSPADSQLNELSKLALTDAANMLNLDGYWVGAATGGYSYKSPAPMYLNLIRQTVGPILEDFEGVWSAKLLPRGQRVRFSRPAVQADDMPTTVGWVAAAIKAKLITQQEGRVLLGYSAELPDELKPKPVPAALAAAMNPQGNDDTAAPAATNTEEEPAA